MVATTSAEAIYELLIGDSQLQTLLGGNGDKRVYREYPQHSPVVNSTTPGYIIITRTSATTVGNSRFGDDEYWQARIIATDPDTRDSIAYRLKRLVNSKWQSESLTITGMTVLGVGSAGSGIDGYVDELSAYGTNVRFFTKIISDTE